MEPPGTIPVSGTSLFLIDFKILPLDRRALANVKTHSIIYWELLLPLSMFPRIRQVSVFWGGVDQVEQREPAENIQTIHASLLSFDSAIDLLY